MTEDDGEWFTDPEHHWQASDLVKCVVSTGAPWYKQIIQTKKRLCIWKQFQCPAY